ncbi:MAG: SAM-dependent methyltransferase [Parvularculaceae bacterium]|nr:SAM-dependent methyltransferase [Parvularculaceae bacterium]
MTEGAAAREITPLEERLIALIKSRGPITVADYMEDALLHPHDGYYTSQAPIGAKGDFTTAPEISQIFGELIGLWLVQSWTDMGSPADFNLIELGPGRGVLMQDILRAARLRPAFLDAAHVWLVETSGRLRHEQQRRLRDAGIATDWADGLADTPPAPSLIIANEFFDCLPIRQFVRGERGWRERLVGLDAQANALAFCESPTPPLPTIDLPEPGDAAAGAIFEVGEAGETIAEDISRLLVEHSGRALIIDYGHLHGGVGETLQAVRRHKYWPVLASPGRADITAHVNFERLQRAAFSAGAAAHGPTSQGAFLERLGLALRLERLSAGKTPEEAADLFAGAHRISSPTQMGELFKVLCVSSPGLNEPAGFSA